MALPESSSKEEQKSAKPAGSGAEKEDKDFDPSAEALIDDIDDERTLEEEEAMNGLTSAAVQEELNDLEKEAEMPIEELLAYYERMRNLAGADDQEEESDDEEEDEESADDEDDDDDDDDDRDDHQPTKKRRKDQDPPPSTDGGEPSSGSNHKPSSSGEQTNKTSSSASAPAADSTSQDQQQHKEQQDQDQDQPQQPQGESTHSVQNTNVTPSSQEKPEHSEDGNGIFKTLLGYDLDDSDDMDEDYSCSDDDYDDDERDWRRVIHVGPEYQAEVPETLSKYDDLPPYQNEDQLVWSWHPNLTPDSLMDYLKRGNSISKRTDICISSASVPKISYEMMRKYREKMLDITTSSGIQSTIDQNQISSSTGQTSAASFNIQDVYMSQSRKNSRFNYHLEQENDDGENQNWRMPHRVAPAAAAVINVNDDAENSDSSSSGDARPDLSTEDHFQDEEQLLYLLLKCNFNLDEALRRRRIDPFKYYLHEPMTLWSQEECLGFEHGLRTYGKDFRSIQENRVQTRSHAEVVAFYYLWKKSERHDVYTNQYKLDRKRSLSHPGTTDYMDKFMDYNDSILNASSSPTPTPTDSTVGADSLLDRAQKTITMLSTVSNEFFDLEH